MKVGDLVIWREGSSYSWHMAWGQITAVSKSGVLTVQPVKKALNNLTFKKNKYGAYPHDLRLPTEYELAYRAWNRSAPKVEKIKITRGWYDNTQLNVEYAASNAPPEDIRLAARELEAFAAWLDTRPVEE